MLAIKFILLFANFLGWFSILRKIYGNTSISICIFPAIWISFGFICNLFDVLIYGFYFFIFVGYAQFLCDMLIAIRKKSLTSILPKNIVFLFTICSLLLLRMAPSYFSYPDEFTFWGRVIKELTFFDQLTPSEHVRPPVLAYPNGPAIALYYFTKFFGYSEGIAIFGASTFFTFFVSFLIYNKNRILSSIILYSAILCLAIFYNPGFGGIYADYMAAINFGVILVTFYKYHQKDHTKLLLVSIPLIVSVAALKQIGLVLCTLMAISIILIMLKQRKYDTKLLCLSISLLVIPQLLDYVWHEKNITLYNTLLKDYSFLDKIFLIFSHEPSFIYKVSSNFVLQIALFFFTKSASLIFLFILVSTILLQKKYPSDKNPNTKHILFFSLIIFSGFCIHRLILYLSVFIPVEALAASSLKRYMTSIVISFSAVLLYMDKKLFIKMSDKEYSNIKKYCNTYLIIFLLLMASRLHRKPYLSLPKSRAESHQETQKILSKLKSGKTIYFYFFGYSDDDCSYTEFELVPYAKQTNIDECHKYNTNSDLQKQVNIPASYDFIYIPKKNILMSNKKAPLARP